MAGGCRYYMDTNAPNYHRVGFNGKKMVFPYGRNNMLTLDFDKCKAFADSTSGYTWGTDAGNPDGTYSDTNYPAGCYVFSSNNNVYYNINLQSTAECSNNAHCVGAMHPTIQITKGLPDLTVSYSECIAYAQDLLDGTKNTGIQPCKQIRLFE